ncbi:MAG: hypothetical protein HY075_05510, partial [Deltaproteobacteria bacterium]|nr:hypothetical protein [Deltaproteobacteria bacterium]
MDLKAIVVAKVGAKIAKVQCLTCKKERAFKAPKGVNEPGQVPAAPAAPKKRKSSAKSPEEIASERGVAIETEWKRLMSEAEKANRVKYTAK